MMPIEWPTDKILQFIEEYKIRPVLWDKDHAHYRISDRKMKAWSEMASIFNTETWELKKKMSSLLASYRRERHKARTRCTKSGETSFVSTWFAYRAFGFLSDKCIERQNMINRYTPQDEQDDTTDTDAIEEHQKDLVKTEAPEIDELYFNEEDLTVLNGIEQQEDDPCPSKKRRKAFIEDDTGGKSETSVACRRDDSDVYGEYISGKMRNFDHKTKCVVQYLFSNILFQADIGRFAGGDFDYEQFVGSLPFKNKNVQNEDAVENN